MIILARVRVDKENGGLDIALREFKRRVNKDSILYEYRRHKFFMNKQELKKFKIKNKFKKK